MDRLIVVIPVGLAARLAHGPIHERRDSAVVMAGDRLGDRAGVELSAGGLQPLREPFALLENVVRRNTVVFITNV